MAQIPSYQNLQIAQHVQISVANTALDGTGTLTTLHESPAKSKGSAIEQIVLNRPSASVGTLLSVNLFIDDGTNIRYIDTLSLVADAKSQTRKFYDTSTFALAMEPGQILKAAPTVSEAVNVFVSGGIY